MPSGKMNIFGKILCLLLCLMLLPLSALAEAAPQPVDFAAQLQLNRYSETVKTEATVKTFVDGDTTHFFVPESVSKNGVLKARYLAVNTPEVTGKVEEWGKKASAFTKEKLSAADSILLESDDGKWNLDSTGDRYLVWVWYRPAGEKEYRCLNLELLQNGLAIANSTAQNRYGSICTQALNQAKAQKLHCYSGEKDPDFYYGTAVEMTLRELRTHAENYNGVKVAFNGVVTMNRDQAVYVEALDPESGLYFGIQVYYGYGLSADGLEILTVGNEVRIVGTMQYYEAGGTWQVSGLNYRMMKPKDPGNIQKLSDGHQAAFLPVDPKTFSEGTVTLECADGKKTFPFARTALATTLSMDGLYVKDAHTTLTEDSSSYGAVTLYCTRDGADVTVRLEPLYENGALIPQERYLNKTVSVKGIADLWDGAYQLRVLTNEHITIEE